jgi:hypothetical protein
MKKKKKDINTQPSKGINFNKQIQPYKTIKTSLKAIIKTPEIQKLINDLVLKCNDIVIDVYQFIRLYNLKKYKDDNTQELPTMDKKFISYCIMTLGTRDNRGVKSQNTEFVEELNKFYIDEFQPIYNHTKYCLTGLNYVLPYLCISISTCLSTNIKEHFSKRIAKFVSKLGGIYYDTNYNGDITDDKEYNTLKKEQLYETKKSILLNKYDEIPSIMIRWVESHKENLLPAEFINSISYDCQVNPFKYLKYTLYINSEFEKHNNTIEKQIELLQNKERIAKKQDIKDKYNTQIYDLNSKVIKLFQPLSLRNTYIPKYITIDTATLINLSTERGDKGYMLSKLTEFKNLIWDKYFRMNKSIFKQKDYEFNYTLQTDGIGCSLLFKHNNFKDKFIKSNDFPSNDLPYIEDLSDEQIELMKTKKIITADPGKKYLLYMMDKDRNVIKYSCMQRDTETLCKRNRKIKLSNKFDKPEIIEAETLLSKYCCKTNDYVKFKAFIKAKYEANKITKEFYKNELYRKLNWRTKTYRQKSEDKYLNNIKDTYGNKDDTLICIGDWSNKNTIKGLASTMGIGLKRLIAKKFNTVLVYEYNTSKKCCNCHHNIDNKKINGNSKFRLLQCEYCNVECFENSNESTFRYRKYLNRDKNSCANMLNIVKSYLFDNRTRPPAFCK